MMSPRIENIYFNLFFVLETLHLVPYQFDKSGVTIRSGSCIKWKSVALTQVLHFIYLCTNVIQSIRLGDPISFTAFLLLPTFGFLIPVVGQHTIWWKKHQFGTCISVWFKLEKEVKETFNSEGLQRFLILFTPVGILHILTNCSLYYVNPKAPIFLYGLWRESFMPNSRFPVILFAILEAFANFCNWQIVCCFTFLIIGFANSLCSWMILARRTKDEAEALNLYYCSTVFMNCINETFYIVNPGIKLILLLLSVTSVHNTITADLPILPLLLMPLTTLAGLIFYVSCYPPMGKLHKASIECVSYWVNVRTKNHKIHSKIWKSFQPLGFKVAFFYAMKRETVLVFFSIITNYVITLNLA